MTSHRSPRPRRRCAASLQTASSILLLIVVTVTATAQDGYERRQHRPQPAVTPVAKSAKPPTTQTIERFPVAVHDQGLNPAPGTITPLGPMPADPQSRPIALTGGTVHTVSGANFIGTVLFDGGVITQVGADVTIPLAARRIDVTGQHVYPSLFAANTVLGLFEIGAVRATLDHAEVGDLNPNVRAEIGVTPSSEMLPVTRANGVLVAMTAPRGGLISGTGAVIQLDGWTYEDVTIQAPTVLVVQWPGMRLNHAAKAKPPIDEQRRKRDERVEALRDAFATARAYGNGVGHTPRGAKQPDRDVKWDAMVAAVERRIPVLIETDSILEIRAALAFAQEQGLRLILGAGRDVARVKDELARKQIPVIFQSTMAVGRNWEPYDVNFATPSELQQAGVLFAISTGSNPFAAAHTRDLPYDAGKAVAFGLDHDAAIAAITLNPARILGVDRRLGSLDIGKDATLFVCDGDPLDVRSNVHLAFIQGREVDLTDRQKRLYERFRLRPRPVATAR